MNAGTKIRIVLVSEDQIMCDGLRALFSQDSTVEVVGQCNDGPEAQKRVRELTPDLVITDVASWACGGVQTIRTIATEQPQTKVIVISAFCSKAFITQALSAGAHGYVVKKNGFVELNQAVKTVCSGGAFLCSAAREVVLGDYAGAGQPGKTGDAPLTEREYTILQLLAEGQSSKQIGFTLDVSSKTVDACRRRLMKRLGVESLADLVKCAIVMGLTTTLPHRTRQVALPHNPL